MTQSDINTVVNYVVDYIYDEAGAMDQRKEALEQKALRSVALRIQQSRGWAKSEPQERPSLQSYVVIGLYDDNGGRFAESIRVRSPEDAEMRVSKAHPDVTIAGVVTGIGLKVVA